MRIKMKEVSTVLVCAFLALAQGVCDDYHHGHEGRILDGQAINPASNNYFVTILGLNFYKCGGAIVNKQWIITSANCARGISDIKKFGVFTRYPKKGQKYAIEQIVVHPEYDGAAFSKNDIALIKIKKCFEFPYVPVRIPKYNKIPKNQVAAVTGWGYETNGYDGPAPAEPTTAVVQVMDLEECLIAVPDRNLTESNLCALDLTKSTSICAGDIGGPLVVHPTKLIGVLSNGIRHLPNVCANKTYPAVYTRVSEYVDWIKENTHKIWI